MEGGPPGDGLVPVPDVVWFGPEARSRMWFGLVWFGLARLDRHNRCKRVNRDSRQGFVLR